MKKTGIFVIFVSAVLMFLTSCKGDLGPAGAAGETGLTPMSFQDGVFPSNAYAGSADNNIISTITYSSANFGSDDMASVGQGGGTITRSVFKFNLTSLVPSNVTVSRAYLTINTDGAVNNTINAHAVTTFWREMECTWNVSQLATPWTYYGGDYGTLMDSKYAGSTTLTFSIDPAVVNSWINTPATNYGIMLKMTNETNNIFINFYTREYAAAILRPKLTIYYSLL
jgi:hypothetical protein